MDLSTVLKRVNNGYYSHYAPFHRDLLQLFWNGCTFNPCHDIWYQQCVVLKVCYMNIYQSLVDSGVVGALDCQEAEGSFIVKGEREGSFIVKGEREGTELRCYTTTSNSSIRVLENDDAPRNAFEAKYFAARPPSYALVRYPLRRVTQSYEAKTEDEVSLAKDTLVYEVSRGENGSEKAAGA